MTAGADTFTVLVTDNNGATATQSVTITHTSSGITFYPLDLTGVPPVLKLPTAYASTPYVYQLKVAGGTGNNRVFSIVWVIARRSRRFTRWGDFWNPIVPRINL